MPATMQRRERRNWTSFWSMSIALLLGWLMTTSVSAADDNRLKLSPQLRGRCLQIIRNGTRSDEFWPSIHAAEALSLAGHGDEVRKLLEPKLKTEKDDQRRCGLARELVRAGDRSKAAIMLDILAGKNPHGHIHACESLYKVAEIGDGRAMRAAFVQTKSPIQQLMAAAALGRCGDSKALALLRSKLSHDDAGVAKIAAWVLARIGDKSDIPRVRAGLKKQTDLVNRAYFQHALAALGDPQGKRALLENLRHKDPAIRTYAAVFASDARMTEASDDLKKLLDDKIMDVRIRAAQSLIVLSQPDSKKSFRAGAAAIDITPLRYPVSMTGSFWDRKATEAHDPLHARALVLDDGKTRIALVVCDSCLISREIYDAAKKVASKKTGIPTNRMLTSATHTHSAPTTIALASCLPDPQYLEHLTAKIAESIIVANQRLAPAKIGWGTGKRPEEVFNRRWKMRAGTIPMDPLGRGTDKVKMNPPRGNANLIEPAGPTDPEVTILSVQTAAGKPLALFASYSLHYVGNIPGGQLSADYFGEFARQIKKRLDGDDQFVGILANGTSGDINNVNFRHPRPRAKPFEQIQVVAGKVADTALATYKQIQHRDWVPLAMAQREVQLAVRRPDAKELAQAKETLSKADPLRRGTLAEIYANETVILSRHPGSVKIKLQSLRVGGLAITANPCESFVQVGLDIKKRSPLKTTMNVGLANGYSGYLPTPEQHALGGYETWRSGWSFLEVNASRKITTTLVELLNDVVR